jgi:hypothetical protein
MSRIKPHHVMAVVGIFYAIRSVVRLIGGAA